MFFDSLAPTGTGDANGDGKSDQWAFDNGYDPTDLDNDDDGMPNTEEQLAGTHPENPLDVLEVVEVPAGSTDTLRWKAKAGITYRIYRSTDLNGWTTAPSGTAPETFSLRMAAADGVQVYRDVNATVGNTFFYHVRVVLTP